MAHSPPSSLPIAFPDRLVQAAVALSAATAYAGTLAFVGAPLRYTLPISGIAAAVWGFDARRTTDARPWAAVTCLVGLCAFGFGTLGLRAFVALAVAGIATFVVSATVTELKRLTLIEGALDRLERLAVRAAIGLAAIGLVGIAAPSPLAVALGVGAWAMGSVLLVWTVLRDKQRAAFFRALYAGDVSTHRVASDEETRGLEALPPLLSGTITDGVLVSRDEGVTTYRGGTSRMPIARCQRDVRDAVAVLERRGSVLVGTLGAMLGVLPVAIGIHVRMAPSVVLDDVRPAAPAVVAPTCVEARPYFHESLPAAVHGLGRATLLTHEEDATLAPGSGLLLIVPEDGAPASFEMRGAALAWANRVPCRDKLSLDVAEPTYHPIALRATVTLDHLVPRADVERELHETVTEMFERDGRAVRAQHVDFGSEEKTFGYAVRYALRHVPGVKSLELEVNGHDGDETLGVREFPVLTGFDLTVK